ncbi:hypothetical protein CNMCM6457_004818 [Aspergillus fumigatiaffinis]|jgi:hypothetical protein|nr:hypothetical protein CNMCM6457_004818 [Aspergillus fumigatiaffinis]
MQDSSHQAQCLGTWKFDYHITWSFYHNDRYAGVGGRSYGSNGGITATHTLVKKLALCTFDDQYKLHIDCPISASDWSVDFVGDDKNWWEQFCGGTKTIPDWVKDRSVQMPRFTLHHGILVVSHIWAAQANSMIQDLINTTAFCCFTRSIGLCMVVAIGGTMFQNMSARYLEDKHLPNDIATTAENYAATLRSMPANSEKTILIVEAFSQSFQTLAQILAGIGGIGWILSFAAP